ncbi:low affinity iron permease family protein [Aestuariivirga sp.]|uniref:low affinity iron permease family protein n=1 Tax=Aestuariivirga sp. TaxID=2650926 RepID=UPI0039E2CF12
MGKSGGISGWFSSFASEVARLCGSPAAFAIATLSVIVWAVTGPMFHFSDTWQMVINTGTTICTFLMVFIIQNSQNRDGAALQIKLDELIRAVSGARNSMLDLESLPEGELDEIRKTFVTLAGKHRAKERKKPKVNVTAIEKDE